MHVYCSITKKGPVGGAPYLVPKLMDGPTLQLSKGSEYVVGIQDNFRRDRWLLRTKMIKRSQYSDVHDKKYCVHSFFNLRIMGTLKLMYTRRLFEAAYFSRGWGHSYPCQWAARCNVELQ